jgi:hypothetical protein
MMPADVRSLLPRDKFDVDAVRAIADAGYPAIAPILDELVDWTADGNWPVARPLADYLISLGDPVAAPVSRVLRSSDGSHKENCLRLIVSGLPLETIRKLEDELRRLAVQPTEDDRREEAAVAAREALARLDTHKENR